VIQTVLNRFLPADRPRAIATRAQVAALRAGLETLSGDPYIRLAETELRVISVFDDLRYDRSDMDVLSRAMRDHAVAKLKPLGIKQTAGTCFTHLDSGIRIVMPKSHALGASPFDVARYTPRGDQDYYLLTPTQTACLFVEHFDTDTAVDRIRALIQTQPVNILRIADYLERSPHHAAFGRAIGHLKFIQRTAVSSEPLMRRRALGSMGF
jgi:hypothetical protein